MSNSVVITLIVFILSVIFLMWRPKGMNEAVPPTIGAVVLIMAGIVPVADLYKIVNIVSGAAITILSTIVMSIVLESIGFFRWAAYNIVKHAKGSGILLYWYIILLCFLMTLFFNNDGSILITTPIIIQIVTILNLKMSQKIPYLVAGALVATASSAPIGVSNLANLIALNIVGLDLNTYTYYMFVPSMLGILSIVLLLFFYFRKEIPRRIAGFPQAAPSPSVSDVPRGYYSLEIVEKWVHHRESRPGVSFHPLIESAEENKESMDWWLFRVCLFLVIVIRASFFAGSAVGIPIEWIAIFGALILIALRSFRTGKSPADLLKKTPWHIILFAFSIYVIVYSLHNIGLTAFIVAHLKDFIVTSDFHAVMGYGLFVTAMSNLLNNLPSVMIGTLALTDMGLSAHTLQVAYLANIIGSDIGSLLTPVGTLASLIWIYLLRKNKIPMKWTHYFKITLTVIPIGLLVSLFSLFLWIQIIG